MNIIEKDCSFCCKPSLYELFDFGLVPHVNKFFKTKDKNLEKFYPLVLAVCSNCFLVQLTDSISNNEMFLEYHHRSSASKGNIKYLESLGSLIYKNHKDKKILEIGSNDLTLFNNLLDKGVDIYGVEPAKNLFPKNKKIFNNFLNVENVKKIKKQFGTFDMLLGINVFAHNSNFKELFESAEKLLNEHGILHIEVAYALKTVLEGNYDTIYHEHFCSYTLCSLEKILNSYNLNIIDAEELSTQGGSLRVVAVKSHKTKKTIVSNNYLKIKQKEESLGLSNLKFYEKASKEISKKFNKIKKFFDEVNNDIVFIGAPGRGVITLNSQKIHLLNNINFFDDTPEKLNLCFPGFDYIVKSWDNKILNNYKFAFILSWNYSEYLINRLKASNYKGKVVVPFPEFKVFKI